MKPPARETRSKKVARVKSKQSQPTQGPQQTAKWQRKELRSIAVGLRQQLKSDLDEPDTCALQARVPKRSLAEVETLLKAAKQSVARKVFHHVRKQRQDGLTQRVPIQWWTELAQRVAGDQEDTISSAFSRMLLVAGTEPRSLQHSEPPRIIVSPSKAMASQASAPQEPLRASTSKSGPKAASASVAHQISSGTNSPIKAGVSSEAGDSGVSSNPSPRFDLPLRSTEASVGSSTNPQPSNSSAEGSKTVSGVKTVPTGSTQDSSNHTPASSSPELSTQQLSNAPTVLSENSISSQAIGTESTVDFENIYMYLSAVHKDGNDKPLTAMECAVILDLVLSLPEELPLLDGDRLQDHFLQTYSQLTGAVSVQRIIEAVSSSGDPQSSGEVEDSNTTSQPQRDQVTWKSVGVSPLNPFMVPVKYLARKEDRTQDVARVD